MTSFHRFNVYRVLKGQISVPVGHTVTTHTAMWSHITTNIKPYPNGSVNLLESWPQLLSFTGFRQLKFYYPAHIMDSVLILITNVLL